MFIRSIVATTMASALTVTPVAAKTITCAGWFNQTGESAKVILHLRSNGKVRNATYYYNGNKEGKYNARGDAKNFKITFEKYKGQDRELVASPNQYRENDLDAFYIHPNGEKYELTLTCKEE